LVRDADPEVLAVDPSGSFKTLSRTDASDDKYTVDLVTRLGRTTKYEVERFADETVVRTTTDPDLVARSLSVDPDERRTAVARDDTVTTVTLGPDPRFGMTTPVATQTVLATPAGKTATVTEARTASPDDPSLPLDTYTRTFTILGIGSPPSPDRVFAQSYDGPTRTITETSAEGRNRFTVLDAQGRVVETEVEGLYPVTFTYDSLGRLERIRQGPAGGGAPEREHTLGYDAEHRLASMTDPLAQVVGFGSFDGGNRPQTITLPDLNVVGLGYDENGNVTGVTRSQRMLYRTGDEERGSEGLARAAEMTPEYSDPIRISTRLSRDIVKSCGSGCDQAAHSSLLSC